MTTDIQIRTAVEGMVFDLERLHDFLKGDPTVDIEGDEGTYPSLAKWLATVASTYATAVDADRIFTTTALGRDGSVDNQMFWLTVAAGLQLYVRTNATTSPPVQIGGKDVIIPSLYTLRQNQKFIELELVEILSAGHYVMQPAEDIVLSVTAYDKIFSWIAPIDNVGSHTLRIVQRGTGVTFLESQVREPDGGLPVFGSFKKYDRLTARRNPNPPTESPGLPNTLVLLAPPNSALRTLSESMQQAQLQRPSLTKPVMLHQMAERVLNVRYRGIQYDDPDRALQSDFATAVFYDMARASSQSLPKAAVAYALNSHNLTDLNGRSFQYADFLSNETTGGFFDREGHTVSESVWRLGEYDAPEAGYELVAPGHGGVANTAADRTLYLYDQVAFAGGSSVISVGDVVTGGTSGAVGEVFLISLTPNTSWGALNQQGILHMKQRDKAFTPGEALKVGGVTKASVAAANTGQRTIDPVTQLKLGTQLNCAEAVQRQAFAAIYNNLDLAKIAGEIAITHRIGLDGIEFFIEGWFGQRMTFDSGNYDFQPGDVVTGGTSGTVGTVVISPARYLTGTTGGGDRAGRMFLMGASGVAVTGDFTVGENLLVGGVVRAKAASTLGPVIGMDDAYGPLLPGKVVNRAKIPGFDAVVVGRSDSVQHPTKIPDGFYQSDGAGGYINFPGATDATPGAIPFAGHWPVKPTLDPAGVSPMQLWNTNNAEPGKTVILECVFDGAPMNPPGTFEWAETSSIQVEDRAGGTVKFSANYVSGTKRVAAGYYWTRYIHRYREGSVV